MRLVTFLSGGALAAAAFGALLRADADDPFPHREHARLFATCTGCHAGIPRDDSASAFPRAAQCATCHDGTEEARVEWTGPRGRGSNLRYSHREHDRELRAHGDSATCRSCHGERGDTVYMAVDRAAPEGCLACHTHRAPAHLAASARCATCHVKLAAAVALSDSQLAEIPRPDDHDPRGFLASHGTAAKADPARCATCHVRESCARCHPNAAAIDRSLALGSAPRIARLVSGLRPWYPTPASHRTESWAYEHGPAVTRDVASCANCHARSSCTTCHTGSLAAREIGQLPDVPAGVRLRLPPRTALRGSPTGPPVRTAAATPPATDTAPRVVRVHRAGFREEHGPTAASGRTDCASCHERKFCTDCHDGAGARRFHALNYMARHAADAYGQERTCTSCHNRESFCRSCHVQNGAAARGAVSSGFHDRQPAWLLQHGQAARVALAGCTSCHQQADCLRCHATQGAWRVSPHGPAFDAARSGARNKRVCAVCHPTDPTPP